MDDRGLIAQTSIQLSSLMTSEVESFLCFMVQMSMARIYRKSSLRQPIADDTTDSGDGGSNGQTVDGILQERTDVLGGGTDCEADGDGGEDDVKREGKDLVHGADEYG
jgi:hypothetical protein